MQPSKSQKILRIISIISIVTAVIGIILAGLMIFGGALVTTADPESVTEITAETDLTQAEVGVGVVFLGILLLVDGIVSVIMGWLGLRAAKDNQKVKPVWMLAVVSLVLDILALVISFINGTFSSQNAMSSIVAVAVSFLMFKLADNIKKEAGL